MKVHNLKIGIRPVEEGLREFGKTLKTIQAGKPVRKRSGLYFVSVEAMRRVLTEQRLFLLQLIRARHPKSISTLALFAGRNVKNVYADLHLLADVGLVLLVPYVGTRAEVIPTVDYDQIRVDIAV